MIEFAPTRRGLLIGACALLVSRPGLAAVLTPNEVDPAPLMLRNVNVVFPTRIGRPHALTTDLWLVFTKGEHKAAARSRMKPLFEQVRADLASEDWAELAGPRGLERVKNRVIASTASVLGRPADEVLVSRFLTF